LGGKRKGKSKSEKSNRKEKDPKGGLALPTARAPRIAGSIENSNQQKGGKKTAGRGITNFERMVGQKKKT